MMDSTRDGHLISQQSKEANKAVMTSSRSSGYPVGNSYHTSQSSLTSSHKSSGLTMQGHPQGLIKQNVKDKVGQQQVEHCNETVWTQTNAVVKEMLAKPKKRTKLIVDRVKRISNAQMIEQYYNTEDIVTTCKFAPRNKKQLCWKKTGSVKALFSLPSSDMDNNNQLFTSHLFKEKYQRHLILKAKVEEEGEEDSSDDVDMNVSDPLEIYKTPVVSELAECGEIRNKRAKRDRISLTIMIVFPNDFDLYR